MDEFFRRIQHHARMVRLWTVQDQLTAVKILCTFFCSSPENINDTRCVAAFASLMLSPHVTVVCACAGTLPSPSIVPGFAFAVARAYCNLLEVFPPQSSLQICSAVLVLDRLKHISMTMVDHPRFDELAVDVLAALANPNFAVRKKVLNLAVSFLTPGNVGDVLRILMNELDLAATSDIPIEYQKMLEEAITECHSAYRDSIMQIILDPKYLVFIDCIRYIKDIMDCNTLLGPQLLKCLLRVLRHVRSSPVCAAAVWAISVCSDSLLETRGAMVAILPLFKDLMDRRDIEKLIIGGGEVEHEYMLASYCYGVKERDAREQHLQPWLMEMEELLFVHIGLTRQADGSYAIASSSKSSASSEDVASLDHTDNLAFLMQSGDALLADFVEDMLSKLVDEDEE
jgi:coatomer subunit beta